MIPANISGLLTPRALAYWFMNDGSIKWKKKSNGIRLCTDGFSKEEVMLLCDVLRHKYELVVSVHKNRDALRIYISSHSYERWKGLVLDHMHPSMLYKLNLPMN